MSKRLQIKLCAILAATFHCNAFVETIHCNKIPGSQNANDAGRDQGITALSALSPQQQQQENDSLNTSNVKVESELSEFLGRTLMPGAATATTQHTDFPLLMSISKEQQEFDIMIGRALDTLRKDYPEMLTKDPDFSIYHTQIEAVDPKGITLHSLKSYKTSFQFLHTLIKFFYCPDESGLTFRLVYDCARKSIRVSWNAILVPRSIYGGIRNQLHVDGISVYEFDRESGLINQHRVEHLLINDAPVEAPQGIFRAIAGEAMVGLNGPDAEGVPVWNVNGKVNNVVEFTPMKTGIFHNNYHNKGSSSLFSSTDAASEGDFQHPLFDQEAFDRKNASRKKFGVPPLTPDEYVEIQAQVRDMEMAAAQRQKTATTTVKPKKQKGNNNLFGKMFGNILQDTCESNFDCERPEICCDLGFKKMCCSSGMRVFDPQPGLQRIPVRVIADDGFPRGGPDGMDNY